MSSKRKRTQEDSFFMEDADVVDVDQDLEEADQEDESEESELDETEAEKRLRLAKSYLQQIKQNKQESEEDSEDEFNRVSDKLKEVAEQRYGKIQKHIASRLIIPKHQQDKLYGNGKILPKQHRYSVTALVVSSNGKFICSVGKEGQVVKWMLGKDSTKKIILEVPQSIPREQQIGPGGGAVTAPWAKKQARKLSKHSKLSLALSSDNQYLAAGTASGDIHVWNAQNGTYEFKLNGHRDGVTGLSFRKGTHALYSCSYDRRVVIWSLEDKAYVDTLFGHQSEVTGIDAMASERAVTVGCDGTVRMWKIPEESCLVFRCQDLVSDAICMITSSEWVTGSESGKLYAWNQLKKKPNFTSDIAHKSAQGIGTESWIQSLAVCPSSDLLASGAGDGFIRFWAIKQGKHGKIFEQIGQLQCTGYVNSLQFLQNGKILCVGVGQEPRLGRWGKIQNARNCVVIYQLEYLENVKVDEDGSETSGGDSD